MILRNVPAADRGHKALPQLDPIGRSIGVKKCRCEA